MFQPHLNYGAILWGNASKQLVRPIEVKQRKAVRILNNAAYNAHSDPLFKSNKILKFQDIYQFQINKFMYQVYHKQLPITLSQMFNANDTIHDITQEQDSIHTYKQDAL